ncbi:helix-turn-helix transcriptional regulator [Pleurocapsa sp. FMAR1]|uniref:helix-turn-helix transcriptional regulator n=1 Tax=Pleurocapsa sp. FMAR1 TaxID=3040204 RepID=UPI0029C6803F|nr:helix-turn-helix transcriptional regulator [Pleurocapsa sp. FMAR1]
MNEKERLKELADFLRTRRAKLSPAQVGLPPGLRRRVPGLRREEVAELAQISVTWYTWLEQTRSVKVSPQALLRIAQALQLDRHEQEHLFSLAGQSPPPSSLAQEQVTESIRQVLESLEPNPAYLVDWRWNLLAWNQAAIAVFGDFDVLSSSECNLMWLAFTNSAMKELFVNWSEFAHCLLVHFRADYAQNASDRSWSELALTLQKVSPQFRQWWKSHDVARPHEVQELNHPIVGKLVLDSVTFQVYPAANLRLTAYTPKASLDKSKLQKLQKTIKECSA